jgi:hypothetical protein
MHSLNIMMCFVVYVHQSLERQCHILPHLRITSPVCQITVITCERRVHVGWQGLEVALGIHAEYNHFSCIYKSTFQHNVCLRHYLYGASARAAAAISGSHLSPFASSFSLLYSSSSLDSVAYSALGPACCQLCISEAHIVPDSPSTMASTGQLSWQRPQ